MKHFTDIKTFEDACKVEQLDPLKVIPDFSVYPEQDREALTAHAKIIIIARAANRLANDGKLWEANWNDENWKFEPWFDMEDYNDGSSGFRFDGCDDWYSASGVGSRLCFISREVCEYIANQFIDLYQAYFK